MKPDRKLSIAVLILMGLVVWLLVISIQRSDQINSISKEIETLQMATNKPSPVVQQPLNGKTPVLGVDYFNGVNGSPGETGQPGQSIVGPQGPSGMNGMSAYDIAVKNGFTGTEDQWLNSLKVKGDKGDPAKELMIQCIQGLLQEKYQNDSFWQITNIKCETSQ
jgi:hypothetical protein